MGMKYLGALARFTARAFAIFGRAASVRFVIALLALAQLSGCGLFGCAGAASNGGAFGGCHVGTRF